MQFTSETKGWFLIYKHVEINKEKTNNPIVKNGHIIKKTAHRKRNTDYS